MKTKLIIFTFFLIATSQGFGQTPNLISASATEEGAITLRWMSQSNAVYRIECANELLEQGTAWKILYNNYPSHGTNTFWLDTGNYHYVPPILHPKYNATRFYRIVEEDTDSSTNKPSVAITFPTNGFVATDNLTITVAASTPMATLYTKLYVDGQEMKQSEDGSNYVINTCEWFNGPHVLFATTESGSSYEGGKLGTPAVLISRKVSPYVSVIFSNLVTAISFSEVFFEPDLGQTQHVSAVFAAGVDWTLEIKDLASNVVRTATGSGSSMHFDWDGNGNGGTNLQAGVYYYYVSAATNGLTYSESSGGSGGDGGSPPSLSSATSFDANPFELPLPPLPPGLSYQDDQGNEVSPLTIQRLSSRSSLASTFSQETSSGISLSSFGGTSAQAAPPTPKRPPPTPGKGFIGTFGVAYQSYTKNGTNGFTAPHINAVNGINSFMTFEEQGATPNVKPLPKNDVVALNFLSRMEEGKWKNKVFLGNDDLKIADLRGAGNPFNGVNIGLLTLHCLYGDKTDFTVGSAGCKQMYYPITADTGAAYLRFSEMNLGGAGTNGLKWMALLGCHTLFKSNWDTMQDAGINPYNNNLRLLLGTDTDIAVEPSIGARWAEYMLVGTNGTPLTIKEAWYTAGRKGYQQGVKFTDYSNLIPMRFAVAGDDACLEDYLEATNNPALSGTWTYDVPIRQVYP